MQLDCETPLDFGLDDLEVKDPDPDTLLSFLAEMEFRTLSKRIADQLGAEAPEIVSPTRPAPPQARPRRPILASNL